MNTMLVFGSSSLTDRVIVFVAADSAAARAQAGQVVKDTTKLPDPILIAIVPNDIDVIAAGLEYQRAYIG